VTTTAGRPLENRVALVTGASSGIGRAIALGLAAHGATVLAVGRDLQRLNDTVLEAESVDARVEARACDVTDEAAVRALGADLLTSLGALDVLVHAAGTIEFGEVGVAPVEQLDRMVAINLRGPYLLTQVLLPLLGNCRGHIVFINSSAGLRPSGGVAAYGATKHALRGLADALRDEVNPLGIRVTSVYPGRTRTPMQTAVSRWEGRIDPPAGLLEPADVATIVVALVSLPHGAEVTDIHIRPTRPPNTGPDDPSGVSAASSDEDVS
jgi:NAD(P)-dependent dehydrogenase (short-subunit alcohol dehydrogenase family)